MYSHRIRPPESFFHLNSSDEEHLFFLRAVNGGRISVSQKLFELQCLLIFDVRYAFAPKNAITFGLGKLIHRNEICHHAFALI